MYEYCKIPINLDDLHELNMLGSKGWHIVGVIPVQQWPTSPRSFYALMERPVEPN
jgi:hypothetical protein